MVLHEIDLYPLELIRIRCLQCDIGTATGVADCDVKCPCVGGEGHRFEAGGPGTNIETGRLVVVCIGNVVDLVGTVEFELRMSHESRGAADRDLLWRALIAAAGGTGWDAVANRDGGIVLGRRVAGQKKQIAEQKRRSHEVLLLLNCGNWLQKGP